MSKRCITSYFTSGDNVSNNKRPKTNENLKDCELESENCKSDVNILDKKVTNSNVPRKKVNSGTFMKWRKQFPWLEMMENDGLMTVFCNLKKYCIAL